MQNETNILYQNLLYSLDGQVTWIKNFSKEFCDKSLDKDKEAVIGIKISMNYQINN